MLVMTKLRKAVEDADESTLHGNADQKPCISPSGYVNRRAQAMLGVTSEAKTFGYTRHPTEEDELLIWEAEKGYKMSPIKGQNGAQTSYKLTSEKMRVVDTGEDHPDTGNRIYRLTPVN